MGPNTGGAAGGGGSGGGGVPRFPDSRFPDSPIPDSRFQEFLLMSQISPYRNVISQINPGVCGPQPWQQVLLGPFTEKPYEGEGEAILADPGAGQILIRVCLDRHALDTDAVRIHAYVPELRVTKAIPPPPPLLPRWAYLGARLVRSEVWKP